MSAPQSFCFCSKPANNRCSACKTVSYCSQECQRRDWQTHKKECRLPTPQVGTPNQIRELVRVGEKHTILRDTAALRLDPSLINGATALDFYTDTNSGLFWRLDQSDREQWEAKAEAHNRDSRRFWTTYLAPITSVCSPPAEKVVDTS
ncbi:hypothetical protein C8R44DRAFT_342401 [Mycena epipterygia]|nr:hypothetical protein C8R44DRAFT_342401 [Mycena epipterygia]